MDQLAALEQVRSRAVTKAVECVGLRESKPNHIANGAFHTAAGISQGEPYCLAGIVWAFNTAADDLHLPRPMPIMAAVQPFTRWADKRGWLLDDGEQLRTGDLVAWFYARGRGHIELVTGRTETTFSTVGFNSDAHADRDGEGVVAHRFYLAVPHYFIRVGGRST